MTARFFDLTILPFFPSPPFPPRYPIIPKHSRQRIVLPTNSDLHFLSIERQLFASMRKIRMYRWSIFTSNFANVCRRRNVPIRLTTPLLFNVTYTKRVYLVSHAVTNYYARIIKSVSREWLDAFYLEESRKEINKKYRYQPCRIKNARFYLFFLYEHEFLRTFISSPK